MSPDPKSISDGWFAMSAEEKVAELRSGRVTDRSTLPKKARIQSEKMLEQARENLRVSGKQPLIES